MPTELERENLHNLDVGDDYHLQGDAKWERTGRDKPYRKACAPLARAVCRFGSRLGARVKRRRPSERPTRRALEKEMCAVVDRVGPGVNPPLSSRRLAERGALERRS